MYGRTPIGKSKLVGWLANPRRKVFGPDPGGMLGSDATLYRIAAIDVHASFKAFAQARGFPEDTRVRSCGWSNLSLI
jgi:hypothetical protein